MAEHAPYLTQVLAKRLYGRSLSLTRLSCT
jgi:hypothetical protein